METSTQTIDVLDIARKNTQRIIDFSNGFTEWKRLSAELSAMSEEHGFCPVLNHEIQICWREFDDSRHEIEASVYYQHIKTDQYVERFVTLNNPTETIKEKIKELKRKGYAVGYSDGLIIAALNRDFGSLFCIIEADTMNAYSCEYDKSLDQWQYLQSFKFKTLTEYL